MNKIVLFVCVLALTFTNVLAISYPFFDDMESGVANWDAEIPWSLINYGFYSSATSFTDSPDGFYQNNADVSLSFSSPLDLNGAINPQLHFWHNYQIEPGFDFAYVELSIDGGVTYPIILATYSGSSANPWSGRKNSTSKKESEKFIKDAPRISVWVQEQLDLSAYVGESNVMIRFRLETDEVIVWDGWYLDDVSIAEKPNSVVFNSISNPTASTLDLDWTQNNDLNFARYEVYRSKSSGVSLNSTLVATIFNQTGTTFTDYGLQNRTRYYYKVYVINQNSIYVASNEQYATTTHNFTYPFFDNMEHGSTNWFVDTAGTWTLTSIGNAYSGNSFWDDSPEDFYVNNLNASLILANDITTNEQTQITFWHKIQILANDFAYVEYSTDSGNSWLVLLQYTNVTLSNWTRVQYPLGIVSDHFRIRFRLQTNASGVADGWKIDDAGISDLPESVELFTPVPQTMPDFDKMALSWTQSNDSNFKQYEIYRSASSGITGTETPVGIVTNPIITNFTDTGLAAQTNYYYKIYIVNQADAKSGSNEESATTNAFGGTVSYPFSDDMENGKGFWVYSGGFTQTTEDSYSGTLCWTESPNGNYLPNADANLRLTIDLSTADKPVLKFRHKYFTQSYADFVRVYISIDGINWNMHFFKTGSSGTWLPENIDLSEYAGNSNVTIRFQFTSDASVQNDGWYIDDVSIAETTKPQIPYPFYDNMDNANTLNNWFSSNWELAGNGHSSPYCWEDSPYGVYIDNINEQLVLSNTIDLSAATHPQLSFWHKYQIENYYSSNYWDYGFVQVSNNKGHSGTWTTIATYKGSQTSWDRVSLNLSDFAGQPEVKVRFYLMENGNYTANGWSVIPQGWWVDDVRIEEAPVDVSLYEITNPTMHSADLSWTQNNDTDFYAYEIYRASSSNVNRTSTLAATISNQSATNFTDTYTILQPNTYFYRIYVKDELGNYGPLGSNVQQAVYTVPQNSYPFFDDFENGTAKWEWGIPWGSDTNHYSSASTSWADSPNGVYANNVDTSTDTYINLSSAGSPILSFWNRYSLQENADWGHVQISSNNGTTWTTIHSVTGLNGQWLEERIDLTAFAGFNIGLRFRLVTNATTTSEGWYIDDISVAEGALIAPYPFFDNMESGIGYWTYDFPWNRVTSNFHSGDYAWTESPAGVYPNDLDASLKLKINLVSAVKPVLTFWHYHTFQTDKDFGYIEISKDLGNSWSKRFFITGSSLGWKKSQLDLSEYAGYSNLMIRFRVITDGSGQNDGWYIDDVTIGETTAVISYPFADSMNDSTSHENWFSSNWELVTGGNSAPLCFHDSPYGRYPDNTTTTMTLANSIDLSGAVKPQLTFWHKYQIENYYSSNYWDYGWVQVSSNHGAEGTYTTIAEFKGSQTTWKQVQLDLSAYQGLNDVRIRFVLHENGNYNYSGWSTVPEGWWIDDVRIENAPTAVTLFEADNVTMHNADLTWSMNHDSTFHRYEVYRDNNANVAFNDLLVATIYTQTDTTFADTYTILQPSNYYYRVYVIDELNTYDEGSNVISANYNVPINSYPFFEDFETDDYQNKLDWNSPWGLSTETAFSGNRSWTDSPVGAYTNSYQGCLTTFIDLRTAVTPFLTYWQKYLLELDTDFGYVEVSTNNGNSWTTINTMTGEESDWNMERIDLTNYAGTILGVRFRLQTSASVVYDGWYIDDISVNEGTRVVSFPFFDDVESGVNAWHYQSPWGRTTGNAYSGSSSWTDSPQGSYANNASTYLQINIDFTNAQMPYLSFYQSYSLQANKDYGRIEVSSNMGASWKMMYYVTGNSSGWREEKIDLAEYAGSAFVMVRFRLTSDASGQSDGWYLDDIRFSEPTVNIPYPFVDNCDDSTSADNWFSSSFEQMPGGQSGLCWEENPVGVYIDNSNSYLTLASSIDLSNAVNPQLTFWHKYQIENYYSSNYWDYGWVQISNYKGQAGTYTTLAEYKGSLTNWTQVTIDLSPYIGMQNARIRFYLYENANYNASGWSVIPNGWWIDNVRIQESSTLNAVDWAILDSPASISMNTGETTPSIYGKVYEPGMTDGEGQGLGIIAELGYGSAGSNPAGSTWNWVSATYASDDGNNDVYAATLTISSGGSYDYCYRYRLVTENSFIYADLDGNNLGAGGWNGYSSNQAGNLEVLGEPDIDLNPTKFTVALAQNNSENHILTIYNPGNGTLNFSIIELESLARISDERADVSWLSVNPVSGNIQPADSLNATVNFSSYGLVNGYYSAYLLITSNDPDEMYKIINVNMMVGSLNPPVITAIMDVPNDEGGYVRVIWNKSENDTDGSSFQVNSYGLWRKKDQTERSDWDLITSMPAVGSTNYDFVAPTLADTTETGDIYWSVFRVSAHTANASIYAYSLPDSGYSVNNSLITIPYPVASLDISITGTNVTLSWTASLTPNVTYKVYASENPFGGFEEVTNEGILDDTSWIMTNPVAGKKFYYVTAFKEVAKDNSK
jgi:bacillopeptidase F (M6 metalloprotease family)